MSFIEKLLEFFVPWKSSKWVMWKAQQDLTTCVKCKELHGEIFPIEDVGKMVQWPMHQYCRYTLDGMDVIPTGYATQDGLNGADYWLTHKGKLTENYLTKKELVGKIKKVIWQMLQMVK